MLHRTRFAFLAAYAVVLPSLAPAAEDYFEIQVVDEQTGRGVPLVELETVNNVGYVTDSNGFVALDEPSLFGQRVFFHVRSHGYELPKDGFGYRGKALEVTSGGKAALKIMRLNIAERLYRVTGGDIYRDSVLLGHDVPIEEPLLNAKVLGQDSVLTTVYKGRIHWFWGDTNRPAYPLGEFHAPGAVSMLPSDGGLDPEQGVNLTYYLDDDDFARGSAEIPGQGPTWLDGLTVLKDESGSERMFAAYVKIKPPLTTYARGLVEWNDATQQFEKIAELPVEAAILPGGHPFKHTIDGVEHVYFARAYPHVRVGATPEQFTDLAAYEAFTCLVEGSTPDEPKLDRTADGTLRYSWKRNAPALTPQSQKKLIDAGLMKPEEGMLSLRDRDTGKPILSHGGSVYWNEHRQRWVMIVLEGFGSPSFLGEVWYAEADTPVGPWVYAVKIVTHDRYDFYNPKQHPMFDKDGGRTIYFEGTYTNTFSGNPIATPRYNYNQVMYRLDLDDPRLALPVAIYRQEDGRLGHRTRSGAAGPQQVAFFALDRATAAAVPVYESGVESGVGPQRRLSTDRPSGESRVAFYGLPADTAEPAATTRPLYEFVKGDTAERVYSTDLEPPGAGYERQPRPVCLVWHSPVQYRWEASGE